MIYIEFKKGIVLSSDLRIQIHGESEFWNLTDKEKISLMDEARKNVAWVRQLENIDYAQYQNPLTECMENDDEIFQAIQDGHKNPYASEKQKEFCKYALDEWHNHLLLRTAKKGLREKVIERDLSTCQYCGRKLKESEVRIDHVNPYSSGGMTEINNLVVSCENCNRLKSNKTPDEAGMPLIIRRKS
jgi:hypothetical protein